jgi:hypothetical protein
MVARPLVGRIVIRKGGGEESQRPDRVINMSRCGRQVRTDRTLATRGILGQQVSVKGATALAGRIAMLAPG